MIKYVHDILRCIIQMNFTGIFYTFRLKSLKHASFPNYYCILPIVRGIDSRGVCYKFVPVLSPSIKRKTAIFTRRNASDRSIYAINFHHNGSIR